MMVYYHMPTGFPYTDSSAAILGKEAHAMMLGLPVQLTAGDAKIAEGARPRSVSAYSPSALSLRPVRRGAPSIVSKKHASSRQA
jgi:hypothetical protein